MILTCPSCGTRYSVDGAKFPAAGRTVRCAKCGHSWHQAGRAAPSRWPSRHRAEARRAPRRSCAADRRQASGRRCPIRSRQSHPRLCAGRGRSRAAHAAGAQAGGGGGLGRADRGGAADRRFGGALSPGHCGDLAAIGRGLFQPGPEGECQRHRFPPGGLSPRDRGRPGGAGGVGR